MVGIGILNLFSSAFIDGICVVALAPAIIIIRGHLQNYIDRSTFLVHFTMLPSSSLSSSIPLISSLVIQFNPSCKPL